LKLAANKARSVVSHLERESATPVAHCGDTAYSVVLYRSPYASAVRVLVTSLRLHALGLSADEQAIRFDDRAPPQREIARQKKEKEDTRLSQEKARIANKAGFRP